MIAKKEFGDYQTPKHFAEELITLVNGLVSKPISTVLEPTCGIGHLLTSALKLEAANYLGIEINPDYCSQARQAVASCLAANAGTAGGETAVSGCIQPRIRLVNEDFFACDLRSLVAEHEHVLVVANPPWVTNSMLGQMGGSNLPSKSNAKGLSGLDALTGASNFDICEAMISNIIKTFVHGCLTLAVICKKSVARNIMHDLYAAHAKVAACKIFEFDATKVFKISASACVLYLELNHDTKQRHLADPSARLPLFVHSHEARKDDREIGADAPLAAGDLIAEVRDFYAPEVIKSRCGYRQGRFYSNLDAVVLGLDFEGSCCFEWRQGVKHDCAKVMELRLDDRGLLLNGFKEQVDIEPDLVYPLVKSSMFKQPIISGSDRLVLVTQKKINDNTDYIESQLPKTFGYLDAHRGLFERRKSSIYQKAPPFAMFGVGPYSYARYKVGVSGFYKQPLFALLFDEAYGRPMMCDDTCYFIDFESYDQAYVSMLLLNSKAVQGFLSSIAFVDAKRPYNKKILSRLDFSKIVAAISYDDLNQTEAMLKLSSYLSPAHYEGFKHLIANRGG